MYHKGKNTWTKHLDFMILDIICLEVSFFLAYVIRHKSTGLFTNLIYENLAIVLFFVDIVLLLALNTLKNVLKRGYLKEFTATLKHVCLLALVSVLYLFSVKDAGDFSRMTFFLMAFLYLFISYGVRILWKKHVLMRIKLGQQKSVLIITDKQQLLRVKKDIQSHSYEMFQVSGIVVVDLPEKSVRLKNSNNEAESGETGKNSDDSKNVTEKFADNEIHVGDSINGIPLVAGRDTMTEYICREWVDEAFIDLSAQSTRLDGLVNQLMEMGVVIHIKLAERLALNNQKQFIESMGKYTVLTTSMNTISGTQLFCKRLLDIIGGVVGCILTGILFLFVAPAIYIKSPGPIIFSQIRIGKNGKKFKLYKFRSMYPDAEARKAQLLADNRVSDGMMFKLDYDPRIIGCRRLADGTVKKGIGNWIRDWSIDEFPQFWNVLKGDMSLVGTRPPTEDEWEKYDLHHRARLAIKPGITGMWQVSGRSNITEFEQVVELDRYYITNWSMGLDWKILCKTLVVVFGRDGSM